MESLNLHTCLDFFPDFLVLDFPRRPPWSYEMSKEQLMSQEERSFQEYLGKIHGSYTSEKLSYFEHNLEVTVEWGQDLGGIMILGQIALGSG